MYCRSKQNYFFKEDYNMKINNYREVRENKEEIINQKTDVLDKVKKIVMIPEVNAITTSMAATYFEVEHSAILYSINKNFSDYVADGLQPISSSELKTLISRNGVIKNSKSNRIIFEMNGDTLYTAYSNQYLINKKSVMRLALNLKHSFTAECVKKLLADEYEDFENPSSMFLADRKMRDKYSHYTSVFDRVKAIEFFSRERKITLNMLADYFSAPEETILKIYYNNFLEFRNSGCTEKLATEIQINKLSKIIAKENSPKRDKYVFFTVEAILRMAMLLANNNISRKIRDELIEFEKIENVQQENIQKVVKTQKKKQTKNKNNDLAQELGIALLEGNMERFFEIYKDIVSSENQEIREMKEKNNILRLSRNGLSA